MEKAEVVWNKKVLGVIGGSMGLGLVLATAFFTHEVDLGQSQTHQNDTLADHERRIVKLEEIAEKNSLARERTEVQLKVLSDRMDTFSKQHEEMKTYLADIHDDVRTIKRKQKGP